MGVLDYSSASGTGSGNSAGGTSGTAGAGAAGYVQGQSAEQMKVDEQFPLLFEGSSFYHTSPIIHDITGDGVPDAILGDYDGTIHIIGLDFEPENHAQHHTQHKRRKRSYKRISIPRLYIRKYWYEYVINRKKEDETVMDNMNTTTNTETNATTKYEEFEPYHTYFATNTDRSIIMIPTMYEYHHTYSQHVHLWNYHVSIPILIPSQKIKWMNYYYVLCHITSMRMNVKMTQRRLRVGVMVNMPMQMVVMKLKSIEVGM